MQADEASLLVKAEFAVDFLICRVVAQLNATNLTLGAVKVPMTFLNLAHALLH